MSRWLFVLLVAGCASPEQGQEGKAAVARGALLLDVRTPEEFASGHLDGAMNVPVQELAAKWASLASPNEREVVVYCRSGRRSAQAKQILEARGVRRVIDAGAMSNWR